MTIAASWSCWRSVRSEVWWTMTRANPGFVQCWPRRPPGSRSPARRRSSAPGRCRERRSGRTRRLGIQFVHGPAEVGDELRRRSCRRRSGAGKDTAGRAGPARRSRRPCRGGGAARVRRRCRGTRGAAPGRNRGRRGPRVSPNSKSGRREHPLGDASGSRRDPHRDVPERRFCRYWPAYRWIISRRSRGFRIVRRVAARLVALACRIPGNTVPPGPSATRPGCLR